MRTRAQREKLAEEGVPPTPPQQLPDTARPRRPRNTRSESAEPASTAQASHTSTKSTRDSKPTKKTASDAVKGKPGRKPKVARPTVTASQDDPASTHFGSSSQNDTAVEPEALKDAEERIQSIEETLEDADRTPRSSEDPSISHPPVHAHPVQGPLGAPHVQETGESSLPGDVDPLEQEAFRLEAQVQSRSVSRSPVQAHPVQGSPGDSDTEETGESRLQDTVAAPEKKPSRSAAQAQGGSSPLSSPPSQVVTPEYFRIPLFSDSHPNSPFNLARRQASQSQRTPPSHTSHSQASHSKASPSQASPSQNFPSPRSPSETSLLFASIVGGTPRPATPRRPSVPQASHRSPYAAPFVETDDESSLVSSGPPVEKDLDPSCSSPPLDTPTVPRHAPRTTSIRLLLESVIDIEVSENAVKGLLQCLEDDPSMKWTPEVRDCTMASARKALDQLLTNETTTGTSSMLRKNPRSSGKAPQLSTPPTQPSVTLSKPSTTPADPSTTQQNISPTIQQSSEVSKTPPEPPPEPSPESSPESSPEPTPTMAEVFKQVNRELANENDSRRGGPRRQVQRQQNNEQVRDLNTRASKKTKPRKKKTKGPKHTHSDFTNFIRVNTKKQAELKKEAQKAAEAKRKADDAEVERIIYAGRMEDHPFSYSSDEDTDMETPLGPSAPIDLAGAPQPSNAVNEMDTTEAPGAPGPSTAVNEMDTTGAPELPHTPRGRSWGFGLVPSVARTVSRFIPGFGRRGTQGRDKSLRETSGNAVLLTKEQKEARWLERQKKKYHKEKALQAQIEKLKEEKEKQEKELNGEIRNLKQQAGIPVNAFPNGFKFRSEKRAELAERRRAAEIEAELKEAERSRLILTGQGPLPQPAEPSKKSKRKRSPSPDVIPNPPGCSYGMDEKYFYVDSSSEDGDDEVSNGPPSSKRKRTSGEFIGAYDLSGRPVIGNPYEPSPYTGTTFAFATPEESAGQKDTARDETPRPTYNSFKVPSPTSSDDESPEDESHHELSTPSATKLGKQPESSTPPSQPPSSLPSTQPPSSLPPTQPPSSLPSTQPESSTLPSKPAPQESTTPQSSPRKMNFSKPPVPGGFGVAHLLGFHKTPAQMEASLARQRELALKYTSKKPSRLQQSSQVSTSTSASPAEEDEHDYLISGPKPFSAYLPPDRVPTADNPITESDFNAQETFEKTMGLEEKGYCRHLFSVINKRGDPFEEKTCAKVVNNEFEDFTVAMAMEAKGFSSADDRPILSANVEAFFKENADKEQMRKEKGVWEQRYDEEAAKKAAAEFDDDFALFLQVQ